MAAGDLYRESGKVNIGKFVVYNVFAIAVAIIIGYLYALIASINPIIYLNFLLLVGVFFLLIVILTAIQSAAQCRNKKWMTIAAFLICFSGWYANWATLLADGGFTEMLSLLQNGWDVIGFAISYAGGHKISIGRFGQSGLPMPDIILVLVYFIEFGVFMIPVYVTNRSSYYYCENCKQSYTTRIANIDNASLIENNITAAEETGNFLFLEQAYLSATLEKLHAVANGETEIHSIQHGYCLKCEQDSVIEVSVSKLSKDDKGKLITKNKIELIKGIIIDDDSHKLLKLKMPLG